MRITVFEDNHSQTKLVCHVLGTVGHVCHAFDDSKEILCQLRRESYDMLIIHWQPLDASGPEVLSWTRERLAANLPVLQLTSQSGDDVFLAGLAAGADDFLIMPF